MIKDSWLFLSKKFLILNKSIDNLALKQSLTSLKHHLIINWKEFINKQPCSIGRIFIWWWISICQNPYWGTFWYFLTFKIKIIKICTIIIYSKFYLTLKTWKTIIIKFNLTRWHSSYFYNLIHFIKCIYFINFRSI